MDFKKKSWIEQKRLNWPEGSLERQLKLRQAKTLVDAVQTQVKDNRELRELKEQLAEASGEGDVLRSGAEEARSQIIRETDREPDP